MWFDPLSGSWSAHCVLKIARAARSLVGYAILIGALRADGHTPISCFCGRKERVAGRSPVLAIEFLNQLGSVLQQLSGWSSSALPHELSGKGVKGSIPYTNLRRYLPSTHVETPLFPTFPEPSRIWSVDIHIPIYAARAGSVHIPFFPRIAPALCFQRFQPMGHFPSTCGQGAILGIVSSH